MAKEVAARFLSEAEEDSALRSKLAEARLESIQRVAAQHGFTFSLDDLQDALEDNAELSPEELDAVAGGGVTPSQNYYLSRDMPPPRPPFAGPGSSSSNPASSGRP